MRRALLVLALAASLAGAGCGDDETEAGNRYVDQVNAVQGRFAASITRLDTSGSSPRAIARALENLRGAVVRTAGEIRSIDPPDAARPAHARLVAALDGYAVKLSEARKGLLSRDPAKQARAGQLIVTATADSQQAFQDAVNEINRKLRE